MNDDRLDEPMAGAAREYRSPPPTPRDRIWAGIEARRKGPHARPTREVSPIAWRRPGGWLRPGLALAAVLLLGIAIGRWQPGGVAAPGAAPTLTTETAAEVASRGALVMRYAAIEHFSRVNTLLTDYQTGPVTDDLRGSARDLLSRTRLLLDARHLGDPAMRALLEDLEMLLIQVSQLRPNGAGAERDLIDDNLTERAIRPRLRNAIPAGPAA